VQTLTGALVAVWDKLHIWFSIARPTSGQLQATAAVIAAGHDNSSFIADSDEGKTKKKGRVDNDKTLIPAADVSYKTSGNDQDSIRYIVVQHIGFLIFILFFTFFIFILLVMNSSLLIGTFF